MSFVIVAVGVGVAAGVGAAYMQGEAAKAAANERMKGWRAVRTLDADELSRIATEGDLTKYKAQFEAQRENDPTFAALRDKGGEEILRSLYEDSTGQSASDVSLAEMQKTLTESKGGTESVIQQLMTRAKEDLDAGATLPPEFQAELVRTGLESAGNQGFNIEGRGAAGTEIRQLVGSQGLALKTTREASARANLSAAESLRVGRQAALANILQLDDANRQSKFNRAGQASVYGSAAMPSIGLSGTDLASISVRNTDTENQIALGRAGVRAEKRLAEGAEAAQIIGAVGSGVSSLAGGGMGGGGSWLSGLFSARASTGGINYGSAAPTYGAGSMAY